MANTVILVNKTRAALVFNLPHASCCQVDCLCTKTSHPFQVQTPDGSHGVEHRPRLVCRSVTVLAGAKSEPLPAAALLSPEVKAAKDARPPRIAVVQVPIGT